MGAAANDVLGLEELESEVFNLGLESEAAGPVEVHLEVALLENSRLGVEEAERLARGWAAAQAALEPGAVVSGPALGPLRAAAASLVVCDAGHEPGAAVAPSEAAIHVHVHSQYSGGAERDALGPSGEEGGGACEVWRLPSAALAGQWEALVLSGRLKADCLRLGLAAATLPAARCGRALLLHGPPGCGKTSLCRALAHKLAVRLAPHYPRARLIEVDAHSLFSRWFSESGKLVARLFQQILELTEDPQTLTIVLVDEVESLAAARASAAAGLEPSDAVRAVNALLTGLDRLRRHSNALLLATSNVTRAVDQAFLDRADLRRRVGPPDAAAAYQLLRGAVKGLLDGGLLGGREPLWPLQVLQDSRWASKPGQVSLALLAVARCAAARRLSGRALARLPVLALALHLPTRPANGEPPSLARFVLALRQALIQHLRDEADLQAAENYHTG